MCVCIFSIVIWLEYGGYCQKGFLLLDHLSPGLLDRGQRCPLEIVFPIPLAIPCWQLLQHSAWDNKATRGNHWRAVPQVLRPLGSLSSSGEGDLTMCVCCAMSMFSPVRRQA